MDKHNLLERAAYSQKTKVIERARIMDKHNPSERAVDQ
jgi:hypothetical protein